jgi:hypothetical protein
LAEILREKNIEILEMNRSINQIKDPVKNMISRLDQGEERIPEIENKIEELLQPNSQIKK